MLNRAKHPSGETPTIDAAGVSHCVRDDSFLGKARKADHFYSILFKHILCF